MVYFAEALVGEQSFVKIGHSEDSTFRIHRGLQPACPVPLQLLLELPGGKYEESCFHARFFREREHGEWFRNEGTLKKFLEEHV